MHQRQNLMYEDPMMHAGPVMCEWPPAPVTA
jgi:hypothetical protein